MGFGKGTEIKKLPNESDILSAITDYEIFDYYLGGISSKTINSPLREDSNPSFSIFSSKEHGILLFKDFSNGDTGDAFVFVMRLFKYSRRTDAFNRIASDFGLTQFELKDSVVTFPKRVFDSSKKVSIKTPSKTRIGVKIREFMVYDVIYWKKFNINPKSLKRNKVFPISHYFINGICHVAEKYAYVYVEYKDEIQTFKIYQPLSKTKKWINNNDYSVWELWSQLPKEGDILIITSSRKDAMAGMSLEIKGTSFCSLQSENVNAKKSVIEELKSRFKRIFVLYDNDTDKEDGSNPGKEASLKICKEHNLIHLDLPNNKDLAEYIEMGLKNNSLKARKETLKGYIIRAFKNRKQQNKLIN